MDMDMDVCIWMASDSKVLKVTKIIVKNGKLLFDYHNSFTLVHVTTCFKESLISIRKK